MTWGGLRVAAAVRRGALGKAWLVFSGHKLSLAFKLAVPVMVTTALLGGTMGALVNQQMQSQIETAYEQQATSVAAGVDAIYKEHPDSLGEINGYLARLVAERPDIVVIRIHELDAAGTVLASSIPDEIGKGGYADPEAMEAIWSGRFFQDENDGSVLTTVAPLTSGEVLFGAVVITSSKAAQVAATQAIGLTIGLAATAAVVIEPIFVLAVLYLGILRRTRRLQRAVEAVAHGDTSVRLAEGREGRGRDEIFNLARSVDHMIEQLDRRSSGDALVRQLAQSAMKGVQPEQLIADGLNGARAALGLETCIFANVDERGRMAKWLDGTARPGDPMALPAWIFALTRVAVEARRAVVSDRLGQQSRFATAGGASRVEAVVVPLPRTAKAGQAIVAIAPAGQAIPDGGLGVLDAVAATISESLHMQAAENARAESAVKSRVMAAVSHEMRNPLNSILGFTGLVVGAPGTTLTDKQRRQLGYVQSSANTMLRLVNNYLDLAKARSGEIALQYETVRLEQLVDEVAGSFQPQADAGRVSIRTSVPPQTEARVDQTRLRQILGNLVSNAVKFTPPGGRVFVRARVVGDRLRIAVSDQGVGIPRDQLDQLFTEFARIDAGTMAAAKGSGLGLALTRAFIVAMGGAISVYSRRGRGTTFAVTLPQSASPAKAAA